MTRLDGNAPANSAYVADQYKDTSKLDARLRLYKLYEDASTPSFFRWVFDAIDFAAAARVLEVGAGVGSFWVENAERVPADAQIVLSDSAPAMLDAASSKLGHGRMRFERVDVQQIPYADASFDIVIANHMLYHVPDRAKALREIARVLRPGGKLYATTNCWTHLIELRALIRTKAGIDARVRAKLAAREPLYVVDEAALVDLRPDDLIRLIQCEVCALSPCLLGPADAVRPNASEWSPKGQRACRPQRCTVWADETLVSLLDSGHRAREVIRHAQQSHVPLGVGGGAHRCSHFRRGAQRLRRPSIVGLRRSDKLVLCTRSERELSPRRGLGLRPFRNEVLRGDRRRHDGHGPLSRKRHPASSPDRHALRHYDQPDRHDLRHVPYGDDLAISIPEY